MKRKVIFIILLIFGVLSIGLVYIKKTLPFRIRGLLNDTIERYCGKNVTIEEIYFSVFKGFTIKNLQIYDREEFLKVKEINFNFLILPFLKKKIIIPYINFDSVNLFLKRYPDKRFNFEKIFSLAVEKKTDSGFSVILQSINIKNSNIYFIDTSLEKPIEYKFKNLKLQANLTFPAEISFKLKINIENIAESLEIRGKYSLFEKKLKTNFKVFNLAPQFLLNYYPEYPFIFKEGKVNLQGELVTKDKILEAEFHSQLIGVNIVKDNLFVNNLNTQIYSNLIIDFSSKNIEFKGKAKLENLDLYGLNFIQRVENMQGDFYFDNQKVYSKNLVAWFVFLERNQSFRIPVEIELKVIDFKDFLFNLNLFSSTELNQIYPLFKERFNLNFDLKGKVKLNFEVKGEKNRLDYLKGLVEFFDTEIRFPQNLIFKNIEGKVNIDREKITWHKIRFNFLEKEYVCDGIFYNYKKPYIDFILNSSDVLLESSVKIDDKNLHFIKFRGNYEKIYFSLGGELNVRNLSIPTANIHTSIDLELEMLKKLFKNQFISQINPEGKLMLDMELKGSLNQIRDCNIKAKLFSQEVKLFGFKIDSLSLNYWQSERKARIEEFKGLLYGGTILGEAEVFLDGDFNTSIKTTLSELRLEKLKLDTPFKDKDLVGKFNLNLNIRGPFRNLDILKGTGTISINEANLWEINLFKGLGELIFPEEFSRIIFTQAGADFIIESKAIISKNISLKSNFIQIAGEGKIGFDGSILAILNFKLLGNYLPLSGTIKDLFSSVLAEAEKIFVVEISGNLQKPKYRIRPVFKDIFEGIKSLFFKESK